MRFNLAFAVRGLLVLSVGSVLLACSAGEREPEATSGVSSAITDGYPDSTDSNVFLLVSQRGRRGVALCTASLIAPNLLLTARHCVADVSDEQVTCGKTTASAPLPVSTILAVNALSADDANVAYWASSVNVPSEDSDICGYDLALVTLTANVPAAVATPLVPRIDRAVARGEKYSAVGYGLDAAGAEGVSGLRRVRAGLEVSCEPGKCGREVERTEFVGELGICSGDSGGPALDQAGRVVGVVSRAGSDCGHPVYGAVASWKNWISQVAEQAAERGDYAAPFWVKSGQSDPSTETIETGNGTSANASSSAGAYGAAVAGSSERAPNAAPRNSSCALHAAASGNATALPAWSLSACLGAFCIRKRKRASFPKRVS